jgi:hypothetical protein
MNNKRKKKFWPHVNPSTQEAEVGESQVPGQPGLQSETLVSKKKKKPTKN